MERRIIGLPVHQTSLIMGLTAGLVGVVITLLMLPFMLMAPTPPEGDLMPGAAMLLILPLMYLVLGYLGTALWVAVFNQVARRTGGLPVQFAPDETLDYEER